MIRLDIFIDPICPWCHIAKSCLERALEAQGEPIFHITWHPFQLNPQMPLSGQDRASYLDAVYGDRQKVANAYAALENTAANWGVSLDLSKQSHIPNTLNAHRLIYWAHIEGRQHAAVSALFRAYWHEGKDIGAISVLRDLSEGFGMDPQAIERLLHTEADKDEIMRRDGHARERGITAVPCFIIADQYVVSGAQPKEFWNDVIKDIQETVSQKAVFSPH